MPDSESDLSLVLEVLHWNRSLKPYRIGCFVCLFVGHSGWLPAHGHTYRASSAGLPWIRGCGLGPWVLSGQGL